MRTNSGVVTGASGAGMTGDGRSSRSGYRVSTRLLATKGGAEPLSKPGNPFMLVKDNHVVRTDEERLTEAVIDATLDILMEPPSSAKAPRGAAPLTDLLDPKLIDAGRRKRPDPDSWD